MSMKSGQPIPFPVRRKPAPEIAPRRRGRPSSLAGIPGQPSPAQRQWLSRGLTQPGGKLPLFWDDGRRVDQRTIKSCMEQGWAEPWFSNPLKPDWMVCKLTEAGRGAALDLGDTPTLDDDGLDDDRA